MSVMVYVCRARNYRFFIWFLASTVVLDILVLVWSVIHLEYLIRQRSKLDMPPTTSQQLLFTPLASRQFGRGTHVPPPSRHHHSPDVLCHDLCWWPLGLSQYVVVTISQ
jgi:hypothetical protein